MSKFIEESWLVITLGVVFACLLAATQTSLRPIIDANKVKALNAAIAEVVPDVEHSEALEIDDNAVFKCTDADGTLVGWAIQASGGGFIDKITLVVGLNAAADTIVGIKVIEHLETPGLGNKIEAGHPFPAQFAGKSATAELRVEKRPPQAPTEIQAITGATWSSRYTTDIVNTVITRIRPKLDEYR